MGVKEETAYLLGGPYDGSQRRLPQGIHEFRLDADGGTRSAWYRRLQLPFKLPIVFGYLRDDWAEERAILALRERNLAKS